MAQFIHYCAQNDRNGNPQRCFVLLDPDDGNPIAAWNEGYYGHDAVPRCVAQKCLPRRTNRLLSSQVQRTTAHTYLHLTGHTMCQVIHISVHLVPDHVQVHS
jgi:hypothetical protein